MAYQNSKSTFAAKDPLAYDSDLNEHLPRLIDLLRNKMNFSHQGSNGGRMQARRYAGIRHLVLYASVVAIRFRSVSME